MFDALAARMAVVVVVAIATPACRSRSRETRPIASAATASSVAAASAASTTLSISDAGESIQEDDQSYQVQSWSIALTQYDVTIEDVEMTNALDVVLKRTSAELVINGGFYDEADKPVGFALSNGVVLSDFSKRLSGGVLGIDAEHHAQLVATESFQRTPALRFAVQCRPRLVVDGQANIKRDDRQRAERTALCVRDAGATLDVIVVHAGAGSAEARGPSLYTLGRWLAARGCRDALNLDGGPSTGAAWRDRVSGETRVLAPRRGVRHAIVFKSKK